MQVEKLARQVRKKSSRALDKLKKAYDGRLNDNGGFTSEEENSSDEEELDELSKTTSNPSRWRKVEPMKHNEGGASSDGELDVEIEDADGDDADDEEDVAGKTRKVNEDHQIKGKRWTLRKSKKKKENSDQDGMGYEEGAKMRLHEKMEFEKWVREVLYAKKIKQKPMQVVKSRLMNGVTITLTTSCIFFLIAFRADYNYVMSSPMRSAMAGAHVTNLLYGKASVGLIAGCWGLRAWFTRNLLRESVLRFYFILRAIEWVLTLWLLFALWVDFGALPYQSGHGMEAGEKSIYFFGCFLCIFGLVYTILDFRKLRRDWNAYQDRAMRAYLDAKAAAKKQKRPAQGFDPTQLYTFSTSEVVPRTSQYAAGTKAPNTALAQDTTVHGEQDIDLTISDGFLDRFAVMSVEEFVLRWDSMVESGSFEREINYVPSVQEMDVHLTQRGFHMVYSDEQDFETGPGVRMFAFAQSQGAVFLIEFIFNPAHHLVQATFRSQDSNKTAAFVSRLELQRILISNEEFDEAFFV